MSRALRMAMSLVGLSLVASIMGCAEKDETNEDAPAKVKAVVLPFLTAAPFFIADEEGYFEEQNLDVEFVRLARNIDAIPALARGEVDVGVGQLTLTVLNAIASGARIRLVAGTGYLAPDGCTVNGLVARRELVESGRLARPESLRGLTVELDVLLPSAYYVERLLKPAGLTIDDLDIVNVPVRANVDALLEGSIDVTDVSEPFITRMVQSGKAVVWRGSQEMAPNFQLSSVMFGPNLLDERPEVGERFMVAFRKAIAQYHLGRTPRNLEIMARATGIELDDLRKVCWPVFRENGTVSTEGMIEYEEWLAGRELLDRVVPLDEIVEGRFVEHANAVLNP